MSPPRRERAFPAETVRLLRLWTVLMLLGGIEFGLSFLPLPRAVRPLVMLPALPMIALVAVGFMNVTRGPAIVRVFAVAALLWLLILLGLGSVDALTRIDYAVTGLH
jgi:cytochrome c oxidase subunit IV